MKAAANPTPLVELEFTRRRVALRKRIRAFRNLQHGHMPNLRTFMSQSQRMTWDSEGRRQAEAVRLFMPSDLPDEKNRSAACAAGLPEVEVSLQYGEALEVLEDLHQGLRTKTMTNRFKIRNATGQRALTRGQGVLQQIVIRIHKAKLRYRYARNQLLRLRSHGAWEKGEQGLQVLADEDVRALNERALTDEEAAEAGKLRELGAVVEGGIARAGMVAAGETKHTLSWIWYNSKRGGDREPDEAELIKGTWRCVKLSSWADVGGQRCE
jgi:hypothetical protein